MADILASVEIAAESDSVRVAVGDLDRLSASAKQTEASVDGVGTAAKRVDPHMANMSRALAAAETRTKAMQQAGLNLGRQFTDVGVTLASGMNPYLIALQQGPQIIDGFQVAAVQMGTTVRGAMAAMGTAIWTALAPLLPIIAAIAAAGATVAAGWGLATRTLTKDIGDVTESMNLTEAQMKRLEEQGVTTTATAGDAFRALGTTIKDMLVSSFGNELQAAKAAWDEFLDQAASVALRAVKAIGAGFLTVFYGIRDTWRMFPSVMGDVAISAANLAISAVEGMVNTGVRLINVLIRNANRAVKAIAGVEAFIPQLDEVRYTRLFNRFEGAASSAMAAWAAAARRAGAESSAAVDGFMEAWRNNTAATAMARISEAAGDAGGKTDALGASTRQTAKEVEALLETLEDLPRVEVLPLDARVADIIDPLDILIEKLERVDRLLSDSASGLAEAFGRQGQAVGDVALALSDYQIRLVQVAKAEQEYRKLAKDNADPAELERYSRERVNIELDAFATMTSAAKGYFDERSGAYKALQVVEQTYRALQFANAIKAMVLEKTEAGATVIQSGIKAAAHGVVAVARAIASMPFPLNIAAGAATAAALASFGVRLFGGGGGGGTSTPTMPVTNDGTGTVLGDSGAASESIAKSLEMAERYQDRDLQMSSQMVASLRSIQNEIGSMTTLIARQIGVGGGFDTSGLGLGTSTSRSLFGLLSTTRTSTLVGQGLQLNAGTLADLIARGVTGSLYQLVENSKTKSGFLGFGGGTTTWTTETRTPMDRELGMQLGRILDSLRTSVLTAAGTIGVEGAEATLNAMVLNLGRIDFTGLSSAEISEKLNAVFSAAGDQMVKAILPGLVNYQQAGEGLLETLTRLATTFTAVDTTLSTMGMTFNAVGLGSLNARLRLVELSGGLEAFTDSAAFFVSEFLTEAQQIAPIQAAVNAELTRLGLSTDIARSQFADLVMGLDVSTEAGAQMYAALMALAPALDKVLDYTEELNGTVVDSGELLRQRRQLEIALMEATGDAAGALAARRADELAALDPTLRALQEQIWAAQDAAAAQADLTRAQEEAAQAAQRLADQRADLEIRLLEAQGRSAEALAARRALEIAAMDETMRPMLALIYAAEDLGAANQAAADAAEEAADRAADIARQRRDLEIQLMEATGDAAGALAARRADELAAMDETLRSLQQSVWAAQDAAAAAEAARQAREERQQRAMDAVNAARDALTASYEREAGALQETIDKFGGFGDSLRAFRKDLEGLSGTGSSYAGARAEFERVAALARTGNADALGSLQGVSQTYLDAALQNVGSALEYQRILASVMGAVDGAIGAADGQKSLAEQQLAALDAQVEGLIQLNDNVLSVVDAIEALEEALTGARRAGVRQFATGGVFGSPTYFDMGLMAEAGSEAIMPLAMTSAGLGVHAVNDNSLNDALIAEVRALRSEIADLKAAGVQTAVNTGQMKRKMDRQEVDGVYVRGAAPGDPVETVAA